MKKLVVGILAHVDAGKTTLSEALLFASGAIATPGRVDKRDAHLDTEPIERARGITVFAKQATFSVGDSFYTLVDTPGHVDFSCETERALAVQDYAILVVSAVEGVQAHTKTLWNLLRRRRIPTFLFVNKTDIADRRREEILEELKNALSPRIVDFSSTDEARRFEDAAAQDEVLMREYFDTGALSEVSLREAVRTAGIFPCFFGAALKGNGVKEFLLGFDRLTEDLHTSASPFGARVYKIGRDAAGARLTYLKLTGGALHPKDSLTLKNRAGEQKHEKIEEIRVFYSGDRSRPVKEATAGMLVAIPGLLSTEAGMGLGIERDDETILTPVLDYRMEFPAGTDVHGAFLSLKTLAEEDPSLGLFFDEVRREIRVHLMGDIQAEVLSAVIAERFGLSVSFGEGRVLYRETIEDAVMGSGHFEPLRHYAEVRLLLEPLPEGSGFVTASVCPTDVLSLHWQRLILSHLEERVHKGVLIGAPLTDVKATLLVGRAHLKHTEGGDFREATFRALRQGLMKARAVLLEPTFDFRMELPSASLGRAMTDVEAMAGVANAPDFDGDTAILTGNCPVATMRSYAKELRAFTRGEGKLTLTVGGYIPCHNASEVITSVGYDPELDLFHTANSVFCKNGSGYVVPWREADALMHTPDPTKRPEEAKHAPTAPGGGKATDYRGSVEEDKELLRIFEMTYGKIKPRKISEKTENAAPEERRRPKKLPQKGEEYLVVDGYNLIFAWEEIRRYAEDDLSHGREILIRLLSNYTAFKKCRTILVFDAYRRAGGEGSVEEIGGITVVYTKEAETADAYIEKATHDVAKEHIVRVVTSDLEEQRIVLGNGALRVSAKEFVGEMNETSLEIREIIASLH